MSLNSRKPPELCFFVDRSVNRGAIAALRAAEATVIDHDERFLPTAKDEEWLTEAGRQGWIVITRDDRIRYRLAERQALLDAHVLAFIVTAKNLRTAETSELLVRALPAMKRIARTSDRPAIYRIGRDAKPVRYATT